MGAGPWRRRHLHAKCPVGKTFVSRTLCPTISDDSCRFYKIIQHLVEHIDSCLCSESEMERVKSERGLLPIVLQAASLKIVKCTTNFWHVESLRATAGSLARITCTPAATFLQLNYSAMHNVHNNK